MLTCVCVFSHSAFASKKKFPPACFLCFCSLSLSLFLSLSLRALFALLNAECCVAALPDCTKKNDDECARIDDDDDDDDDDDNDDDDNDEWCS